MTKMLPKNTENSYSGWSNYDTWNLKLWIDNDQKTHEMVLNAVKYAIKTRNKNCDAIYYIQKFLEKYAVNNAPELQNSFYSNVLNASIRSVNYYQIADAYYYDYLENYNQEIKTA